MLTGVHHTGVTLTRATDPRITLCAPAETGGCPGNDAIARACGDWFLLLDCGDCLAADALLHVAGTIHEHPDAAVLYSDEDKLAADGQRHEPHFKPEWNPDLLLRATGRVSADGIVHVPRSSRMMARAFSMPRAER